MPTHNGFHYKIYSYILGCNPIKILFLCLHVDKINEGMEKIGIDVDKLHLRSCIWWLDY